MKRKTKRGGGVEGMEFNLWETVAFLSHAPLHHHFVSLMLRFPLPFPSFLRLRVTEDTTAFLRLEDVLYLDTDESEQTPQAIELPLTQQHVSVLAPRCWGGGGGATRADVVAVMLVVVVICLCFCAQRDNAHSDPVNHT